MPRTKRHTRSRTPEPPQFIRIHVGDVIRAWICREPWGPRYITARAINCATIEDDDGNRYCLFQVIEIIRYGGH